MKQCELIFDSKNRHSGSLTNPKFKIEPAINNVKKIAINQVIVPNTMYGITSSNNVLTFTEATNTHTATISPSTYTGSELATALVTAMNYATLLTSPNYTNTVSFDSKALKFTITSTVSIGDGFTLTYGGASDILPSLGFTETQANSVSYTSNGVCDLNASSILHLRSTQLGSALNATNYVDGVLKGNTLMSVPITSNFGEFVHFKRNLDISRDFEYEGKLHNIDFELFDPKRNAIADLNGHNFVVILQVFYK